MSHLFRGPLTALMLLMGVAPLAAQSAGDTAIRARAVLKKHCAECHDGQAASRSSLVILDHAQLVKKDRKLPPFVKPKAPGASQIVEFIEDGSMPPGDRPKLKPDEIKDVKAWIEGGAAGYPRKFDDAFAHSAILADLETANAADRKSYRYFSLHHLVEETPDINLSKERESFRLALRGVAKKEQNALTPIDGTESIFRVDLREIGWDAMPFRIIDPVTGKQGPKSPLTVFDILLLEYPHAEMPPANNVVQQILSLWLEPIHQIRPVIFVRADWFVQAIVIKSLKKDQPDMGTPLKADLIEVLGTAAKARGTLPQKKTVTTIRPEDLPNVPVRPLSKTIPIEPIDAFYVNDIESKNGPKITIKIADKDGKIQAKFKPGEHMKMEITASETAFIELIQIFPDGDINSIVFTRVDKNVVKEVLFLGKKDGLLIGDFSGQHRFVVFAAPDKFNEGQLLDSKRGEDDAGINRYVHKELYELPMKLGDPPRFDSTKMTRKTAIIEVGK